MEIGEKISRYLKSNGISQAYVSRKTGISYPKLSLVLTGKRKLAVQDYELICGALNVPVSTFLQPRILNSREGEFHEP